jgi:DNA-binding Lrp family transcriptional regulator
MDRILNLLEQDARLSAEQIASMIGEDEKAVAARIRNYERQGVILGYNALVDWDKTDREYVSAIIELKVEPTPDRGFDKIAERIYRYPEVESVSLISSAGYDLLLTMKGKTMKEIAYFVAYKLATLEDVRSTATHFVLKKYKEKGKLCEQSFSDERDQGMI